MAAPVQPLRVVTMHGVEPFIYEHANGTFSGYLVDLLRPLLDAAGLTQPAEIYAVNVRVVLRRRRRWRQRQTPRRHTLRQQSTQQTHNNQH